MILKSFSCSRTQSLWAWSFRYHCGGRYSSLVHGASNCRPLFSRVFVAPLSSSIAHSGFFSSSRQQPKWLGILHVTNETLRISCLQVFAARNTASASSHSAQTRTDNNGNRLSSYNADWSVHELYMVTCSEMWDDRPHGAQMIVGYIDTAASLEDSQRRGMSTALVLTSCLTDDIEIMTALQKLIDVGFRLIIPSMIGMSSLVCMVPSVIDQLTFFCNTWRFPYCFKIMQSG
jgi:hypothetical protein